MSQIAYDPVKDKIAGLVRGSRWLRSLLFRVLDLFFLRSMHVRRAVRNIVKLHIGDDRSWNALDAGMGFGQYDAFLLRSFKNIHVHAVDIKQHYLDDCRHYFAHEIEKGRITFDYADLLKWDQPPQYDLVLCVDVLEHIEEDVEVMRRLAGSMKPGSYFVMHSPSHYAEEDAGEDETFVGEHARVGYSAKELEEKMRRAGLTPVKIRYTYGKRGHKAWQWMIQKPMLWINRWGIAVLLPLIPYYLFVLPFALIGMRHDVKNHTEKGTGILGIAKMDG